MLSAPMQPSPHTCEAWPPPMQPATVCTPPCGQPHAASRLIPDDQDALRVELGCPLAQRMAVVVLVEALVLDGVEVGRVIEVVGAGRCGKWRGRAVRRRAGVRVVDVSRHTGKGRHPRALVVCEGSSDAILHEWHDAR